MRWSTNPWTDLCRWHQWFAWHPVRLNKSIYQTGHWVWLETIWRKRTYGFGDCIDNYSLHEPTEMTI